MGLLELLHSQDRLVWTRTAGIKTLCITAGGPWGNGKYQSFDGKFKNELLNSEGIYSLKEAGKRGSVENLRTPAAGTPYGQALSSLYDCPPGPETRLPPAFGTDTHGVEAQYQIL